MKAGNGRTHRGARERKLMSVCLCAALSLVALGLVAKARADGFIVVPDPIPVPEPTHGRPGNGLFPLRVVHHDVRVTIRDQHAVTEIDQVFANPQAFAVEGMYLFPVPEGAAVSSFSMWVGERKLEAELLDAEKARAIYTSIVAKAKDPALLEYAGRRLYRVRIFPVPAGGRLHVRLRYDELLSAEAGMVRYRYPLATERFSSAPLERCTIRVDIEDPVEGLLSPSHEVETARAPTGSATVRYEAEQVLPDRDFVLLYRERVKADRLVGLSVLSHFDPNTEEGTFLTVIDPAAGAIERSVQPKDIVFVLDTSGSMAGSKIEQAKAALRYCLRSLDKSDRFALIDFASEARSFNDALTVAKRERIDEALAYVDRLSARGGTDLEGALRAALALDGAAERAFMVVLITDGEPTVGVTDPEAIEASIKNARAARTDADRVRLFCLGIGAELNVTLLDRLAEQNRGSRNYIAPGESIEVAVSAFYDKIRYPALSNVRLEVVGADAFDLLPRPLPDLFYGSELLVMGRYRKPGEHVVRLRGELGGERVSVVTKARFADHATAPFLPRMHAVRKVAYLLDQIRLHGENEELRKEVAALARRYGIVTPYTSFLIVEEERKAAALRPGARVHPVVDAIERIRKGVRGYAAAEEAAERAVEGKVQAGADAAAASEALSGMAKAAPAQAGAGASAMARQSLAARGRFVGAKVAEAEQGKRIETLFGQTVRVVGDRTFYRAGDVWVEAGIEPGEAVRTVGFATKPYFALLENQPELGPVLALGTHVRFKLGDAVIEVRPERAAEKSGDKASR